MGEADLTDDERTLLADLSKPRRAATGWFLLALCGLMAAGSAWGAWHFDNRLRETFAVLGAKFENEPAVGDAYERLGRAGLMAESHVLQQLDRRTGYAQGLLTGRITVGLLATAAISTMGVFGSAVGLIGWGPVAARDRLILKLHAALADRTDGGDRG